jgi:hypothetical protein
MDDDLHIFFLAVSTKSHWLSLCKIMDVIYTFHTNLYCSWLKKANVKIGQRKLDIDKEQIADTYKGPPPPFPFCRQNFSTDLLNS